MKTIPYKVSRDIPVDDRFDVVVVGGGPGGLGAAVMAARNGARTLLVERYGYLGGMAAAGEIHPFMPNHANGTSLDRPVHLEWVRRMRSYMADSNPHKTMVSPEAFDGRDRMLSKDLAMLAAEDLCLEAGVQLLYHHTLADVVVRDRAIDMIVLHSKSGFSGVRARVYVDTTGDADLAARAGCEFEIGGPSGHCQPMTLCFKLAGVDRTRMPEGKEIHRLYLEAKARGEIQCPREDVLQFKWFDDDVIHFNTTRIIHRKGTEGAELSEAEIEGRRQLRQYLAFLRKHVPGFEKAEIHSIAHHVGVRESRRVKGLAYLERPAFRQCAKFPDAIARVRYGIDIHNPDGTGTEHDRIPEGEWYEIPYGCIVARDVTNLLVAGRPISVDHAIHSSMRVMPPACSVGQAAGTAAAMSAARGVSPHQLDGCEVRAKLKALGANL